MAVILDATPGAATANSYCTVARGQQYFDMRLPVAGWDNADSQAVLLMMATRVIDASLSSRRTFMPPIGNGRGGYYVNRPTWTGLRAAGNLSKLAWTRSGMYDRNGILIPENVFPDELADATAELAGALGTKDTTLDNSIVVKGITDIKAGPISLSFASGAAWYSKPLPESVLDLLVPSWMTLQSIDSMYDATFAVVSE
jgi:hypothetical protein